MKSLQIRSNIRQLIKDGKYSRFDRLPPSRELAEKYGVARNTIREALNLLEVEGYVETRANSGTYVIWQQENLIPKPVEHASPLQIIEARFALEPHTCRLCVLHGNKQDFDKIESLCDKMDKLYSAPIAFAECDAEFHALLAKTTKNELLMWLIDQINTSRTLEEWMKMRRLILNEEVIKEYNIQHRKILAALRERSPELAANMMKNHLESARIALMRSAMD